MKKLKTFSLALLLPLIFMSTSVSYSDATAPENIILSAANSLFADVEKNKEVYENDISSFYGRVDRILTPIIDFDILIKSITGKKKYSDMPVELKNRFKLVLLKLKNPSKKHTLNSIKRVTFRELLSSNKKD